MNFDKQYIRECDCGEIQRLRPILEKADWVERDEILVDFIITCYDSNFPGIQKFYITDRSRVIHYKRNNIIWLPSGDQLDDEIVKICRDKNFNYGIEFIPDDPPEHEWNTWVDNEYGMSIFDITDTNPLIAKIKLLKALLEKERG